MVMEVHFYTVHRAEICCSKSHVDNKNMMTNVNMSAQITKNAGELPSFLCFYHEMTPETINSRVFRNDTATQPLLLVWKKQITSGD